MAGKQGKALPAESVAFLAIERTADALMQSLAAFLKPSNLSPAQYNVLRILRGAGKDGLACGEVSARMIARDPDMTRLLDRLEARKLVERTRGIEDRRVVTARITPEGLELLAGLDRPIAALHRQQLGHLGTRPLAELVETLEKIREAL